MAEFKKWTKVIVYTTLGWLNGRLYELHATGMISVTIDPVIKGNRRYYPKEARPIWPSSLMGVTVSPAYIRESPFKDDEVCNENKTR